MDRDRRIGHANPRTVATTRRSRPSRPMTRAQDSASQTEIVEPVGIPHVKRDSMPCAIDHRHCGGTGAAQLILGGTRPPAGTNVLDGGDPRAIGPLRIRVGVDRTQSTDAARSR
ncbi:hypothetical protein GCM10023318_18350 [Nocardia callitridis]|uniref:Uncharacterized protein n=1 Tax=Nocardia callitridis TaxID=648753 RepID=A0ABP9K1L3_9NOCA